MRPGETQHEPQTDDTIDVSHLIVRRIAKSLGVPLSTLTHEAGPSDGPDAAPAPLTELRALLNAFLRLEHPAARRRCVALAEAELTRQQRNNAASA